MGTFVRVHPFPLAFISPSSSWALLFVLLVRNSEPYLAKFRGKPGQLSPKARLLMFAGWLLPSRFKSVQTFPLHSLHPQFSDWMIPFYTVPSHHSIDTTGSSTVQKRVRMSDTSSTTIPLLPSPTVALCSVSTFDLLLIASLGSKLVLLVGRRSGLVPRRGKIKLEP